MKNLKSTFREDSILYSGIICILISATIFTVSDRFGEGEGTFIAFMLTYGVTAVFTTAVLVKTIAKYRWGLSKGKIEHTAIMLILWFISAFSLNKEMNVFDSSTLWLSISICIASLTIVTATIRQLLPIYLKHIMVILLGASIVLLSYYAIYLFPLYILGILASIFIGLSLHVFVPVYLAIITMIITYRTIKEVPSLKYSLAIGVLIPILVCISFSYNWHQLDQKVRLIQNQNTLNESKLPEWVVIAQQIPQSSITEKFLKTDIVYATPMENNNWFWGDFGGSSLDMPKQHDPLVMAAELFSGRSSLGDDDKIKILKSVYDSRHLAQERLWNGDHLETANVVSNIMIYPEYRIAYTEKTLSIRNTNENKWINDEEAIYTFWLPEGAVVSSLSLWIEGIEEKARLTTKGKADSAYQTIVGTESRDPSVIHWQEGNTVSVRVFPCNKKENRKFKIGITSPLRKKGKELIYENTYFSGPTPKDAIETIQLGFSTPTPNIKSDLELQKNGTYTDNRNYKDQWMLSCSEVPLSSQVFSFAGTSYRLKEAVTINKWFNFESIYLDINSSWSKAELDKIWPHIKTQKVYVYDDHLTRLTEENIEEAFEHLAAKNFSLFPFYKIANPANSLVITKSKAISPNLSDLDGSAFQKETVDYLANAVAFHLFNIGETISPYLKTLKEFGVFKYSEGNLDQLIHQIEHHQLRELLEKENALNISNANMNIEKTTDTTIKKAPDHLLRLFAYNQILKKVGPTYFEKNHVQADLLTIAEQAFIVSPVSSMIVLETQKDYERFGIEQNKNSLKNASIQSSGAAPEPHEWMLIMLVASVIIYFLHKSGKFSKLKLTWKY